VVVVVPNGPRKYSRLDLAQKITENFPYSIFHRAFKNLANVTGSRLRLAAAAACGCSCSNIKRQYAIIWTFRKLNLLIFLILFILILDFDFLEFFLIIVI
jgi:hypothetical protein